ncbi:hypothetical protein AX16_004307 [Volvariella volvacea WC 439]|nr:hypothetical protein AX16_004307 [Volvariella volvacea WC 439]
MSSTSSHPLTMMSIPVVHGPFSRSFEEVRIEDYIKAYSTTGRPPMPCPQTPTSDTERISQGLPLLFRPYPESQMSVSHLDLQASQPYTTVKEADETFESICCVPGFRTYSHEEMRYFAYAAGFRHPPTPVPTFAFVQGAIESQTPNTGLAPGEQIQSIVGQTPFSKHSPEELRFAYMRTGRELNSEEIMKAFSGAVPAPVPGFQASQPTLFGSTAGATPTTTTTTTMTPNPLAPQTAFPFGMAPSQPPTHAFGATQPVSQFRFGQ